MHNHLYPLVKVSFKDGALRVQGDTPVQVGHVLPGDGGVKDGVFVAWAHDKAEFRLEVDRYGASPCYYYLKEDAVYIATTVHQLAGLEEKLSYDYEALAVFLQMRFFIGGRTPFREIRKLRAGGRITASSNRITVTEELPEWDCDDNPGDIEDSLFELFAGAIRRRTKLIEGRYVHPLSGGRDSRHILFELARQGVLPEEVFTVRLGGAEDASSDEGIARQIATTMGIPQRVIVPGRPSLVHAEIIKNFNCGFAGAEGAWMTPCVSYLMERESSLFDGIGGDALCAGLFVNEPWERLTAESRWDELTGAFIEGFRIGGRDAGDAIARVAANVLGCSPGLLGYEAAASLVREELNNFTRYHNPATAFLFFNRTTGVIAASSFGGYRCAKRIFAPFLDHRFFDYMIRLPARFLADHTLHTKVIQNRYPAHAGIPFTERPGVSAVNTGIGNKVRQIVDLSAYCIRQRLDLMEMLKWIALRPVISKYRSIRIYSLILLYQAKACMNGRGLPACLSESGDYRILQRYMDGGESPVFPG